MKKALIILAAAAACLQTAGGRVSAQYIPRETPEAEKHAVGPAVSDKKAAEAKKLIEEKGEEAFDLFRASPDKWLGNKHALHIVNATKGDENEGLFLVYPQPKNVGKGAFYMPLVNGKPYLAITHGSDEDRGEAGWFRLMRATEEDKFHHAAILAKAPGGKTYAIAAAANNLVLQKLFIEELVKAACLFMQAQGEEAFKRFSRKGGIFDFKDTYVYVLDTEGRILFDPGLPQYTGKTVSEIPYFRRSGNCRFLASLNDYLTGEMPGSSAEGWERWMRILRKEGKVWGVYLAPRPGEHNLSVKAAYARLIKALGKEYVVGSGIYLADYGPLADPEVMKKVRDMLKKGEKGKEAQQEE